MSWLGRLSPTTVGERRKNLAQTLFAFAVWRWLGSLMIVGAIFALILFQLFFWPCLIVLIVVIFLTTYSAYNHFKDKRERKRSLQKSLTRKRYTFVKSQQEYRPQRTMVELARFDAGPGVPAKEVTGPPAPRCPKCNSPLPDGSTTCRDCGGNFNRWCPKCESPVMDGMVRCKNCGNGL
jgi:uncharacterized membrane protein